MLKCFFTYKPLVKTLIVKGKDMKEVKQKFETFIAKKNLNKNDFIYDGKMEE